MKLRDLNARFLRYEPENSTEQVMRDGKQMYVFRDDKGEPRMWSPRNVAHGFKYVEALDEADGIRFLCPKCYAEKASKLRPEQLADPEAAGVGIHSVRVHFTGRRTPADATTHNDKGQPVWWDVVGGTGMDDLRLAPSILLIGGCGWHGFVGSSGVPPGEAR